MAKLYSPVEQWLRTPTDSGRHQTLFAIAARLAEEGYSEEDAWALLRDACDASSSRQIADREVDDAVRDGFAKASGEAVDLQPKWPTMDPDAILQVLRSVADPIDLQPLDLRASAIVPKLYRPDEILYIGSGVNAGRRVRVSDWARTDDTAEFVTPNPYGGWEGVTKQGTKTSGNCKDGILCRRYIIVEFDLAPDGQPFSRVAQAKILTHLATTAPLVLAVDSGGKSIHGWFAAPKKVDSWFARAVQLGADPALWRIQQLTRLPGGLRQNGTKQPVLWWGLNESGEH